MVGNWFGVKLRYIAQGKYMDNELKIALENMSSRDYPLRHQAFEVINQAREQAVPGLLDVLRNDDGRRQDIALSILWGFFRNHGIRHPDLVSTLVTAIEMNIDNNPLVMLDGIGLLADLKDPTTFDDFIRFIQTDSDILKDGAVQGLLLLADARAIPYLLTTLKDEDKVTRGETAGALRNIARQNPSEVPQLLDKLRKVNTLEAVELIQLLESDHAT